MATTPQNLPSFSSSSSSLSRPSFSLPNFFCNVSPNSLSFQIPKKITQISCHARKRSSFIHPIKHHEVGYGVVPLGVPQNGAVNLKKKMDDRADLMAANAAEVVAPTSAEEASSPSKSSKKGKNARKPRRILDIYQILRYPIITESAVKNIADENALLFTVDVRADKKMIKDAVNNFFGVKVRKVNTSIRPDGTKKAFIMLSREYNASEVAKSIGIFPK